MGGMHLAERLRSNAKIDRCGETGDKWKSDWARGICLRCDIYMNWSSGRKKERRVGKWKSRGPLTFDDSIMSSHPCRRIAFIIAELCADFRLDFAAESESE